MTIQGKGHSLTCVQDLSDSALSNFLFLKQKHQAIEAKFHMEPPWDVENENGSDDQDGFQAHI